MAISKVATLSLEADTPSPHTMVSYAKDKTAPVSEQAPDRTLRVGANIIELMSSESISHTQSSDQLASGLTNSIFITYPNALTPGRRRRHNRYRFTGYVVQGRTSTFGWPTDAISGTADGGNSDRACIAIRNDSTLHHMFQITVLHHQAEMPECDWGPNENTGRNIDITGKGVMMLHMDPWHYQTDSWGVARELR